MLMLKQSIKSLSLEDYSVSKRKKKKEKEKGVCVWIKKPHTYRNHATTKKNTKNSTYYKGSAVFRALCLWSRTRDLF